MDQLLEKARDVYEGEIDFSGQALAEFLTTALLCLAGAAAFIAGYTTQNIWNALYVGLAGTALTFAVIVPPWPFYNQNPQKWRRARSGAGAMSGIEIQVDGKQVS